MVIQPTYLKKNLKELLIRKYEENLGFSTYNMDVAESELASIKGRSPRDKGVNEYGTNLVKNYHRKPRTLPYWHTKFNAPGAD